MKKYILLLFLGFTGTLHAQTIELAVPNVSIYSSFGSIRRNWCAPACAECVLRYYAKPNGQCEIMDYLRTTFNVFGGNAPNSLGCCSIDPPNWSHPCDAKVPLGFNDEEVSIKTVLTHFSNGTLYGPTFKDTMTLANITYFLTHNELMIAQWNYTEEWKGSHVVVIYGIKNGDEIWYMDPNGGIKDWLPYNEFCYDKDDHKWVGTLLVCSSTRACPCHCYNNQFDPDKGETGVDCGGSCPPCTTPPPPPYPLHCYNNKFDPDKGELGVDCGGKCPRCPHELCANCKKDPGEQEIDCGGKFCPPCEDVPEVRIVGYSHNLPSEVVAFKKIITKNGTQVYVESGQNVSFITEETGSIVLLPGFWAKNGSNFSTQRKNDLSGYSRICPEKLCSTVSFTAIDGVAPYLFRDLLINNLLYAVKIEYEIYDEQNQLIYENVKNVAYNGYVYLWTASGAGSGTVTYSINCTVHYCNGEKHNYKQNFLVWFNGFFPHKYNAESGESETPPQFFPPNPNDTPLESVTSPPNFVIIPNPNSGTFQLETNFPLSEIGNLKVTNLLGVTVYETQNVTEHTIQLQNQPAGQYFVVMILKDGTMLTQKIMIQR